MAFFLRQITYIWVIYYTMAKIKKDIAKPVSLGETTLEDSANVKKGLVSTVSLDKIAPSKIVLTDIDNVKASVSTDKKVDIRSNKNAEAAGEIIDDDKRFIHLIKMARNGLPYKSFHSAQNILPFSLSEWAKILQTSERTIGRIKKEKKKLNTSHSEKLIDITLLFDYGINVFGSGEKFSRWLSNENLMLGGVKPKSLLDTSQGIKAVETELSRIEYGVLA